MNRRRQCGTGNVKSAIRKKTIDDEEGRKSREIPGARNMIARIERKENRITEEKKKTEENQKQAKPTTSTNSSVTMCNFMSVIYIRVVFDINKS